MWKARFELRMYGNEPIEVKKRWICLVFAFLIGFAGVTDEKGNLKAQCFAALWSSVGRMCTQHLPHRQSQHCPKKRATPATDREKASSTIWAACSANSELPLPEE